jgi:hypothetical protein
MLYRVFAWDPTVEPKPLDVPRERQGTGRHDAPDRYLALYLAREPQSAVAERIQAFRGHRLTAQDLVRADGRILALASLDDRSLPPLVDLDDPAMLVELRRRPSQVATGERLTTQGLALGLFRAGAIGMAWWSIIEAGWTNVTLFGERLPQGGLPVHGAVPLSLDHPDVIAAADRLGIRLS